MRNYFLNMSLLALALTSISAQAEVISKEAIPAPIMEQFYKKHPNAVEISAAKKTHFKQTVFEIMFKEEKDKEKLIELYRPNGRFFVNANNVQGANMMPAIALDNLKTITDKDELDQYYSLIMSLLNTYLTKCYIPLFTKHKFLS